jgi:hypothetical protein
MRVQEIESAASRMEWVKSSYSSEEGGECVEVALMPATVHVRDSKDAAGPILSLPAGMWTDFVRFAASCKV